MNGPDNDFRKSIAVTADSVLSAASDEEAEHWLEDVLAGFAERIAYDVRENPVNEEADAWDVLAKADSWASAVSYAIGRVYAPTSPWPRNLAGWSSEISKRLQNILRLIHSAMTSAVQFLSTTFGITSFSIGLSFPWGVTVSLNF